MDFILKRRILIVMLFAGLTMLGYVSYKRLPVELLPNTEFPALFVQILPMTETDPDYMEKQAVIPVEGAVGTLEGIEKLETTITSRYGIITVYYNQKADLKYAYLKLQEKIALVKTTIPDNFQINVVKIDIRQLTNQFMELQVRGEGGVNRIRNIVDREIRPELQNIDGIADVEVYGGQENSIEVRLDRKACKAYGITMNQVAGLLNDNSREKIFAGKISGIDKELFVNISSEYTDVGDIGNITVKQEGPVLLRDIAQIVFGVRQEESYSRVNGMDAVTMTLVNDNQANLIDLSHRTLEEIDVLNDQLKSMDATIVVQNNSAELMEKNISEIINLALAGGLLAVLILWFFLRNLKLVSIIAISIPVSVYTAFNFFYAAGITINSLTLVGMALAIGMLVDNSVVVLENVYRLAGDGFSNETAVKQGSAEVRRSIFAATVTTLIIFLPFVFSSNFAIRLVIRNISVSIISTLLISLLTALLLIPMATYFLLSKSKNGKSQIYQKLSVHNRLIQAYSLVLKASMRNPAVTIIGTLVLFFSALLISLTLSLNNPSEIDTPSFRLSVTMPAGSTLSGTDAVVTQIENRLAEIPEQKDIISRIEEDRATVIINLAKDWNKNSKRELAGIKNDISEKTKDITGAEVNIDELSASGGFMSTEENAEEQMGGNIMNLLGLGSQNEKIIIKGQDFENMRRLAEDIEASLDNLPSINNVILNIQSASPEVHLNFDMDYINRSGFSLNDISAALLTFGREYTSGATFSDGTDNYSIILKYEDDEGRSDDVDKTIDDLINLEISSSEGSIAHMDDLADIVFSYGMGNIHRENQEKQITVTYAFKDEINDSKELLENAREEIENVVSALNHSTSLVVEVIHEEDALRDFYSPLKIAFILIFMVLAAVFESLWIPFVLLLSIPLAGLGSIISLILTNNSLLNLNTLIGFLILLGIVVNNGIILIDYTKVLRNKGYRRSRALMTAGMARLRPILITAATTVIALIPLAMGKAEYVSVVGATFAITVIGGLAMSSLLTLVFIPTFYSGLESSLEWIKSLSWKKKIIQGIILIVLLFIIYKLIDKFLWQLITTILALIVVPSGTWFVLNSLRKARETVIPKNENISIHIQSLVKIYDRENRWQREWKAGARIRKRLGYNKKYTDWKELSHLLWQLPVFIFLLYFTYLYLKKGFWIFSFSIVSWLFLSELWNSFSKVLAYKYSDRKNHLIKTVIRFTDFVVFWIIPMCNLIFFYLKWNNIATVLFIALLWYSALVIYKTGNRLTRDNTDINRLQGRFKGLRKNFYKAVAAVPLIGKKKTPFKALNCISLNIGNGMFGLLGPNGAGKTTLMRIICGILEQSYGKIWINGLDTQEKREELQGLIGYLPQEFGSYENMTAHEYLHYQAMLKNITDLKTREERVNYVLRSVHMEERRHEKISSYSGGMKQRIGIALILLHLPRILVVDEPTAGLDPRERIRFRNLLAELSRERVVIFSTHIIEDISSSCNKIAVMDKGKLRYTGKPVDMIKEAEGHVWQFYIPEKDFGKFVKENLVVHHMSEGEKIRVRVISEFRPWEEAVAATPNLEDAYLWLLRRT